MNLLLAFLILAQTEEIPESGYGLEIRPVVDYEAGLVYYEEWVDSLYLGVAAVQTLDDYLASVERGLSFEEFKNRLRQKATGGEGGLPEGIIPDIKIQIGKERTDVQISGQDRITMGSEISKYPNRVSWVEGEEEESKTLLSGIKLEQELDVSVKGVIARKTEVVIDHSSGGTELTDANKVRISYSGDEDEIVKKIEAGDVALNLPSHQSLPAHQGLFGINAQAQLGPVDLYAVASREQTKSGTKEFTGSSEAQHGEIMDRDYIQRRYFYVFHEELRGTFNDAGAENHIAVYLDDRDPQAGELKGNSWLDPSDTTDKSEVQREKSFERLYGGAGGDYEVRRYKDGLVIELTSSISNTSVLAVACTTSAGLVYGQMDTFPNDTNPEVLDTVLNLLTVWPNNPTDSSVCWTNMRRNHYNLPGKVGVSEIKVEVYRQDYGGWERSNSDGERYAYLLGLTKDNNTNIHTLSPDEVRLGELIFTDLYPFADSVLGGNTGDSIYWARNLGPQHGGVYKIEYEYESLVKSYTLEPFLEDNSVQVWVKGEEWEEGEDFRVDYTAGTVTLLKPIEKTDEVLITYETKVLFALDRKSLLGLRAESEITEGVKVGGSFLFRSVGFSGEGRPTLGLEPYSRTIGELDFSVQRELEFLTRWIDLLPVVTTEKPSQFNLNVNSAVSMPNPNTHKSQSVWIEDFEGTREGHTVGLSTPADWYITSLPMSDTVGPIDTALFSDTIPKWRLKEIQNVREEIYDEETPVGQLPQQGSALKFTWNPEDTSHWTGIISSTYGRLPLDITEAANLELIMKPGDANGRIHFEFGSEIDEDQLRRNRAGELAGIGYLNKEDKDDNNEYSNDEDTGLDGVAGSDTLDVPVPGDDGNDDYTSGTNPNGTERNTRLDSEDLLRDGFTRDNHYYSFTLDLKDTAFFNEYVDNLGQKGWIKVSVPLGDTSFYVKHNSPDKSAISMFRIWFDGMDDDIEILFYSWDFVGNKWKDPKVFTFDTTAQVDTLAERVFIDVIGTKIEGYSPPFKLGKTPTGEEEEDNSLQVRYENIASPHGVKVSRWDYSAEDFRGYQRIKLYVHNDANDPIFYLRMGTDSMSYYEVRSRISEGEMPPEAEDVQWREFTFELEDLARLKVDFYDSLRYRDTLRMGVTSEEDPRLRVRGLPSFAQVKYFELGLINDSGQGEITGEVWFNDIRLEGPYREIGTKLSTDSRLVLADVGSISANYSRDDGKFIDFMSAQGPRTKGETHKAGLSGNLNLDKFGPDRLGFKLPVNFGYSTTRSVPRYSAEVTDYILQEEDEIEPRKGRSDVQTLSFSVSHPQSKSRLLKYTLDAVKASANYKKSGSATNAGLSQDSSFIQNYALSYSVNPDLYFTIFEKEKIRYFPSSISFSTNFDKVNSTSWYRSSVEYRTSPEDTQWYPTRTNSSSLTWSAGSSYSIIQYLPLSGNYTETRALKSDVWVDDLLASEYVVRGTSLSSGIKNINLKSLGRPSISVSSSFTDDQSEGIYEQFIDAGFEEDSFPTVRSLSNNGTISFAWGGFNPNGLITDAKNKVEKNLRDLRQQMRESARDSLEEGKEAENEIGEESGLPMDTLPPDTFPGDTLPVDSLPGDSLPADSLPPDSIGEEPKKKLTPEEKLHEERLRRLETIGKVTKIFMPLSADVSFSRSSGYGFYTGPFDWAEEWDYIVGLSDVIVSDSADTANTHTQPKSSRVWNESYKANSGLSLLGLVVTGNVGYTYSTNTQYSGALAYNSSLTLPSISVSYNKIGDLLKKWANSSQLRSGFSRVLTQSGEIYDSVGVDTIISSEGDTTRRPYRVSVKDTFTTGSQLNFSPLISWNTSWKGRVNTDFSINYGIGKTHNTYGGQDLSTETITKGGLVSVGYTFNKPSGFKLPFLKHVKFKNDLSLSGTLNYNQTLTRSSLYLDSLGNQKDFITTTTSGIIHTQYTFSDAFDGGANFTVTKYTDSDKAVNDHTDTKLDIFVVFRF